MREMNNNIKKKPARQARVTTGYYRTTNLGPCRWSRDPVQQEIGQWRLGLRLLSLPQGSQAGEVVSSSAAFGRRLTEALSHSGRTGGTVFLEELLQEEEAEDNDEAEKARPGLTMFTDGS